MASKTELVGRYDRQNDSDEDVVLNITITARIKFPGFGKISKGILNEMADNLDTVFADAIEAEYDDCEIATATTTVAPILNYAVRPIEK